MLHEKVERKVGIRGWLMLMAVAAVAMPVGITWAQDDDPPPPPRRERPARVRDDERQERRDEAAVSPPARPIPPSEPTAPRAATAPRQATAPAAPAPAQNPFVGFQPMYPSAAGYGQAGGLPDDMRAGAEMAVRQAELDLKARRIKVKQAQSAVRLRETEVSRVKKMVANGTVSTTELDAAVSGVENAAAEYELAQVEVERGELAVEQAKRRMGSMPRINPPASAAPAPPGGGFGFGGGGGGAGLGGSGGGRGGAIGGSFGGTLGGGGSLGGGLSGTSGGMALAGRPGMPPSDPFFRNFDRQGTGKIRRDDVPEWMRDRFFEMVDTNKDGVVDQEEFNANYSKLWGTSRPGGGRGVAAGRNPGEPSPAPTTRPAGEPPVARSRDRDPRDERIEQLETELREMRKALDSMRKKSDAGR